MANTESALHLTVEQVLADAAAGRPNPLLECAVKETDEVWGAEPNTRMDVSDIDGWDCDERG